jgi:hypothetical protein
MESTSGVGDHLGTELDNPGVVEEGVIAFSTTGF